MSKGIFCLGLTGLICVATPGCIHSSSDSFGSKAPTVGEELRDLKVALDEGALQR